MRLQGKGTKLAEARGHRDKIFAMKWNPDSKNGAVTVGVRHLKFWTQVQWLRHSLGPHYLARLHTSTVTIARVLHT